MKASIHRMEIDRIRFVLSSYLRSRLQKVSKFSDWTLQTKYSCCSRTADTCMSVYLDWKVFPTCVGEGEVPSGGRAVAAFTRGVCLCQRVSIEEYSCRREWGNAAFTSPTAHRYYSNTETYLKAAALKRMPPNLQTMDMLKAGENPQSSC